MEEFSDPHTPCIPTRMGHFMVNVRTKNQPTINYLGKGTMPVPPAMTAGLFKRNNSRAPWEMILNDLL